MPEVNGLEVLAEIKKISPDTPTIVISGAGRIEDAVEAIRLGANDFIIKPIKELSILLHIIKKALDHNHLILERHKYQERLEEEVEKRTRDLEESNEKLKKTNRKIQKQHTALIEEERLKVLLQMAGTTAHEPGQPLTVLLGCIEILSMMQETPDKLVPILKRIENSGQHIAKVVQKMQSIRHYQTKQYANSLSIIDIEQHLNFIPIEELNNTPIEGINKKTNGCNGMGNLKGKKI